MQKTERKCIHQHSGWRYPPQTQLALGIVFQCAGSTVRNKAYYSVQGHNLVAQSRFSPIRLWYGL